MGRQRARVDTLLARINPPLEQLERKHFPTERDRDMLQYRSFVFKDRLAKDCTHFRYNPDWARKGIFQPVLQEVSGNIVIRKRDPQYFELRNAVVYFRKQRWKHARGSSSEDDFFSWVKVLDGYRLFMKKHINFEESDPFLVKELLDSDTEESSSQPRKNLETDM